MKVLLLAQRTLYSDIIIRKFCEISEAEVVGLIYSNALFNGKSKIESLKLAIRKGGMGVILGKALDMTFSRAPKRRFPFPVFTSNDVNSQETIKLIEGMQPEIIFSVFFNQIINRRVFSIPRMGTINIHPSYLPKYQGIGPTFWVLANNEKETGLSYHFITSRIDKGDIIRREVIPISAQDSVHSLYLKSSRVAAKILPEVIEMFSSGKISKFSQNESEATYFGMPDKSGYQKLRKNRKHFITYRDIIRRGTGKDSACEV